MSLSSPNGAVVTDGLSKINTATIIRLSQNSVTVISVYVVMIRKKYSRSASLVDQILLTVCYLNIKINVLVIFTKTNMVPLFMDPSATYKQRRQTDLFQRSHRKRL